MTEFGSLSTLLYSKDNVSVCVTEVMDKIIARLAAITDDVNTFTAVTALKNELIADKTNIIQSVSMNNEQLAHKNRSTFDIRHTK
jgi:hypothetical protein